MGPTKNALYTERFNNPGFALPTTSARGPATEADQAKLWSGKTRIPSPMKLGKKGAVNKHILKKEETEKRSSRLTKAPKQRGASPTRTREGGQVS